MRDITDAPSVVPDLTAAVVAIQRLAHAKREGDVDTLTRAESLFANVPGLRETVHEIANGKTYGEIQGERSRGRKVDYKLHYMARARAYKKRRNDAAFLYMSDSELKEDCGGRPVPHPTKPGKQLRPLARAQSIDAINKGLILLDEGSDALTR